MDGIGSEPVIDELTRDLLAKELDLKNFGEIKNNQDNLKLLMDWAYAKGAKERVDVIWAVKQLANRVGSPKIGNNWPQHLAQFAYLELERMKIEGQLKEMEGKLPEPAKSEEKPEEKEVEENGTEETNTTRD
jgi:hypothetical protein